MRNSLRAREAGLLRILLAMVLISCGGGGGGGDREESELTPDDLVFAEVSGTENPENPIIAIATTKEGTEAIGVLGERDASGNPVRITGGVYISEEGTAAILQIGADGLPVSLSDSSGNTFIFENYTNSTVDVSLFDASGNLIEGPVTVSIDPATLTEIKNLFQTISFGATFIPRAQSLVRGAGFFTLPENLKKGLKIVSLGLGTIGCASGFVPACFSLLINGLSALTLSEFDDAVSTVVSGGLCAINVGVFECLDFLADLIVLIGTEPFPQEGPIGDPTCSDGVDNDRDGLIDLSDPNCTGGLEFDFALDSFAVDGNILESGEPDGIFDFFDGFNDGSLTTPPTSFFAFSQGLSATNESNGFLNFLSSDGAFVQPDGSTINDDAKLTHILEDGAGDSLITGVFRADIPEPAQFYSIGVADFEDPQGEAAFVFVEAFNTEDGVLVLSGQQLGDEKIVLAFSEVNLASTNRIHLRLEILDNINGAVPSYSLDGGLTFIEFSPSIPIFITGSQAFAFAQGGIRSEFICNDGIDNDGDGLIDLADPDCL